MSQTVREIVEHFQNTAGDWAELERQLRAHVLASPTEAAESDRGREIERHLKALGNKNMFEVDNQGHSNYKSIEKDLDFQQIQRIIATPAAMPAREHPDKIRMDWMENHRATSADYWIGADGRRYANLPIVARVFAEDETIREAIDVACSPKAQP